MSAGGGALGSAGSLGGVDGRVRTGSGVTSLDDMLAEKRKEEKESEKKLQLHPKVAVMTPILRFLQLLCENHNRFVNMVFYSDRLEGSENGEGGFAWVEIAHLHIAVNHHYG